MDLIADMQTNRMPRAGSPTYYATPLAEKTAAANLLRGAPATMAGAAYLPGRKISRPSGRPRQANSMPGNGQSVVYKSRCKLHGSSATPAETVSNDVP